MFLLFINDIHKSLNNTVIKLFADNTNCFLSGNDFSSLERLAETELNKLQTWINANNLTINYDPKKSSYCIFKPKNKCFPPNYNRGLKIGINTLKFNETTKYLGLLLDSKLTCENHIQELNKKMVKYTKYEIRRTLNRLELISFNLQMTIYLYSSCVMSILSLNIFLKSSKRLITLKNAEDGT